MTALPRGTCPVCGSDVALRVGGQVREHRVYLPQLEQDPSTPLGRTRVCEGSGMAAEGRQEEDTVAIEAPERTEELPAEPLPDPDADDTSEPADDSQDVEQSVAEVLEDPERVSLQGDPRQAVVSILAKRLERVLQPVDEDPVWVGVNVITRRDLDAALLEALPPASSQAASVKTPAFIYVDAVCPVCGIAGEISLEITAVLTVEAYGRRLKLKAKASDMPHQCGQQRIRDVTPTRPVKGQTALDLGADEDPEDEDDLRPTGEVNADELHGAALNDAREAEGSTDGADDPDTDLLPF